MGAVTSGFANWMNRLAVGWFVLDQTDSALMTALAFTMQSAPGLIAAPIGGAISDRFDRRYVLASAGFVKGCVVFGLAFVAVDGIDSALPVILLMAVSGVTHSFELPATQALIPDAVGKRDAMNGIALHSVGMRAVGALGAFAGGGLLEAFGPVKVFMIATSLTWVGAGIILTVRLQKRTKAPDAPRRSVFGDIIDGLRVMFSIPTVRTLLIMAVLIEILCFSYGSVLPVLAKNVLHLDESGLGTLTGMAGVGSLIGAVVITLLSDYKRKGLLMIGVAALYGVGVLSLGASSIWMLSLLVITLVGMSAALFDALQWGLLQANVPDAMRGRAMGGWVFAIGFGWIGHLELGLVSDAYGVQWALGVNGVLVIIVAAIALGKARSLRNT